VNECKKGEYRTELQRRSGHHTTQLAAEELSLDNAPLFRRVAPSVPADKRKKKARNMRVDKKLQRGVQCHDSEEKICRRCETHDFTSEVIEAVESRDLSTA
jgi:7-cyano-7-deazaguanine synthase in queuosine biosynthesis